MKPIQSSWFWRSLPLEERTGSQIFETLFLNQQGTPSLEENTPDLRGTRGPVATLLESPYPTPTDHPQARYSICAGAPRSRDRRPCLWTPPIGEILPFIRQLLQKAKLSTPYSTLNISPDLPFTGGWLGWLGYDLAWEIEKLPFLNFDPLRFPVAYWYEPADFAVLDHQQQQLWLAASDRHHLDSMQRKLEFPHPESALPSRLQTPKPQSPRFQTTQADYEQIVRVAKKYIHAGDIFQANLSLRFEATTPTKSWAVYRALQQINPSPFASYWQTPWGDVVSCSPERLVHLQGKNAQTRPIAGTRSRGETSAIDTQLAADLLNNAKERAEHIMLLDLERNDLGRVCEWGSVKVNELLTIERYSHVMHLVSNVTGTLKPECDAVELIRAMFPGGTITGCPKVRCMEIIEELEPVRRSLFYGSCGYLDWRGHLDLNILIRTLLFSREHLQNGTTDKPLSKVWGQVGAGIVADSDPEKEWYESLHKAQAQLTALTLAQENHPV